mgnify:CR=1 FL=1
MDIQKAPWERDHVFGQDEVRAGEKRILWVAMLTGVTMLAEVAAGLAFGSMALLADGIHMASHCLALGIVFFAYLFARRHARNPSYSFGTGKVNALGGFSGALLLMLIALGVAWESLWRFFSPVEIDFGPALGVAVLGLLVNAVSAWILEIKDRHEGEDHNLKAAYLHVIADALTSLLAIMAILCAWVWDAFWLDAAVGLAGAVLIGRWSWGLLRDTSRVLLDWQASGEILETLRQAVEKEGARVEDLHIWNVGPGICACEMVVVTEDPKPPKHYESLIPKNLGVVHAVVEVHRA